jgi:transposase InsO family protein
MDPNVKFIVDEMEKKFASMDMKWEKRFSDLVASKDERLVALERTSGELEAWRPTVDAAMDDIKLELRKMNLQWDRARLETAGADMSLLGKPEGQLAGSGSLQPLGDPIGRDFSLGSQSSGAAGKGMNTFSLPPRFHGPLYDVHQSRPPAPELLGKLPKLAFPVFAGDNPRLWISHCEAYFDMYSVDSSAWVRIASMHLSPIVACWFQSVQRKYVDISWPLLCKLLHDRFDRDQYQALLRQLFRIRQIGTVAEYIDRFSTLVDQLTAYNAAHDPLYFTTRFVDGLRGDIRAVVLIQRPTDLDTACTLALLQEEVSEPAHRTEGRKFAAASWSKPSPTVPLPASPGVDKGAEVFPSSTKAAVKPPRLADDKMGALRAYRRARGLCDKCAQKWHRGHVCSDTIQLQAIQEVFDLFPVEPLSLEEEDTSASPEDTLFLAISNAAVSGGSARRTIQFHGLMQHEHLLVLVDSGSTHSFLSAACVSRLPSSVSLVPVQMTVRVANGEGMHCTAAVSQAVWTMQGCEFVQDLKVLPLQFYDLILGMDWLESFSPMKVDWKHKWMVVPYKGGSAILQGICPGESDELLIHITAAPAVHESDNGQLKHPAVTALLEQFKHVFSAPTGLPPARACDHSIPLVPGAQPVNIRPYRYPPHLKDEIEKQVAAMVQMGTVRPSSSPFSSPVLLVRKKDGTFRFCVDYRYLNALTLKSKFPIPVFDQLMDELSGASWFTTLDLLSGYHQVRLKPGEEYKTAFQTHYGHFEFAVMAFGLTGAPGTFQGAMNTTLKPLLRRCVLVFFDDILIYSKTFEEHLDHLAQVLSLLAKDQWYVKLSKCKFAQRTIAYLGHVISEAGVSTDLSKVEAVNNWPKPTNVKQLRSFLGLAGYYRKFVHHFAVIAKPLTTLLKKGVLFVWTQDHDLAFTALKQALTSAPVLALPDFAKQFCIETDASKCGVGAVLLQEGHPLAFISKPLGVKTQGLSTYEKEYLAILLAVEHWRPYLLHGEFLIYTDQKSLIHLNEQRLHTPWQQKVFTKLLGMQYKVVYKLGTENRVADALSRREHDSIQCSSLSVATPQWCQAVLDGYLLDDATQQLLTKLTVDATSVPNFSLQDGLLRFKGRVWIGNNATVQQSIMSALHASPVGGHSGIPVTYQRIKKLFAWPAMKKCIQEFVASCTICQQAKPERVKYPGLLQPLPVPDRAWQTVTLDFVEGLPMSGGFNCILVVVDKFSKFAHFLLLKHPFTAATVAKVFMQNVYKLHGLPSALVSDRDRVFTSALWKTLFSMAGVSLHMSSAYHPQSDGQTERVNQCLETFLRCFVHACPHKWSEWIHLAEFWYNTSWHSALTYSPFEVLYGYSPRHFGVDVLSACPVPSLSDWIQEKAIMTDLIQQHLKRAQHRMKQQADKNRVERQFSVGDLVFLKLQPYVQTSVARRSCQKLAFRYFGPYRVLAKIGSVAYKLELPATSAIHPIFHVSQLKRVVGPTVAVAQLPDQLEGCQIPVHVLKQRVGTDGQVQVFVQWSDLPVSLATWEDFATLRQQFPFAPAWGQAGSLQGGNVSKGTMSSGEDVPEPVQDAALGDGPRRSGRIRRVNSAVCGPEWITD